MHQVERIVEGGIPAKSITIVSPYYASRVLMKCALANATSEGLTLSEVHVRPSDDMQGDENDVIIFLSVTAEDIGFVAEEDRLYVSLSRPTTRMLCIVETKRFMSEKATKGARTSYSVFATTATRGLDPNVMSEDPLCHHSSIRDDMVFAGQSPLAEAAVDAELWDASSGEDGKGGSGTEEKMDSGMEVLPP